MDKTGEKKEAEKNEDQELMHDLKPASSESSMKTIGIFLVAILLGVGTGYVFAKQSPAAKTISGNATLNKNAIQKGATYGSTNTKAFPDSAEGIVAKGGIGDEGQYHLVRPGGDSQNVYMTSSNVDLSNFVGKKVKVWGQTQQAQQAGWLMDVGRVEVE